MLSSRLASQIPIEKKDVLGYRVQWDLVDERMINDRFKPWVTRKIKDLLGDEDHDVTTFIIEAVLKRETPEKILQDMKEVGCF